MISWQTLSSWEQPVFASPKDRPPEYENRGKPPPIGKYGFPSGFE